MRASVIQSWLRGQLGLLTEGWGGNSLPPGKSSSHPQAELHSDVGIYECGEE
jgi:hypothetical protein